AAREGDRTVSPRPQRSRPGGTSSMGRLRPQAEPLRVGDQAATPPGTSAVQSEQPAKQQTSELTESGTSEVPKYQTLIRKETRVRADQETALAQLRRQVSQRRTTRGGERITENTLIRIAIDLL